MRACPHRGRRISVCSDCRLTCFTCFIRSRSGAPQITSAAVSPALRKKQLARRDGRYPSPEPRAEPAALVLSAAKSSFVVQRQPAPGRDKRGYDRMRIWQLRGRQSRIFNQAPSPDHRLGCPRPRCVSVPVSDNTAAIGRDSEPHSAPLPAPRVGRFRRFDSAGRATARSGDRTKEGANRRRLAAQCAALFRPTLARHRFPPSSLRLCRG